MNGEEPWFVAADICRALELENVTKALKGLDDDEVTLKTFQGKRQNIITESGLYALILRSYKPQAKPFRKWVTSEVLPSIRKTGQYKADWWKQQHAAAASFKPMMGILQLTRQEEGKETQPYHYANEAKWVNWAMTGLYARIDRDGLPADKLDALARLEVINAMLMGQKIGREARKVVLKDKATSLLTEASIKLEYNHE